MSLCCTFTATRVPSLSLASCTWPSDALASGARSKSVEDRVDLLAELRLDALGDLVERARRHLILQPLELAAERVGQEVRHDREQLADLDEQALELEDRDVDAPRVPPVDLADALAAVRLAEEPRLRGEPHVAEDDLERRRVGAEEAPAVRRGAAVDDGLFVRRARERARIRLQSRLRHACSLPHNAASSEGGFSGYAPGMRTPVALAAFFALAFAAVGCDDSNTTSGSASSGGSSSGSADSGGSSSGGSSSGGDPVLDDARQYNLQRINALRAQNGRAPLALDDALDTFAQAASTELSQDHQPHQYFIKNAPTCGCGIMAENQGDPSGWQPGPIHDQIDQILELMMSGGPGEGHHDNILSASATRLGVGIVNPGARMFFTNDFGQ